MPKIRLSLFSRERQPVILPDQSLLSLEFFRLIALLRIGSTPAIYDGLMDSGAPLTVVPERIWRPFESEIEWLTFPTNTTPSSLWTEVAGVTGGTVKCQLGRISMVALDLQGRELAPVQVIAKFAEDGTLFPRILVGLHVSILQGRRFTVDVDCVEGWLEDR
jgi:hypothetical protein